MDSGDYLDPNITSTPEGSTDSIYAYMLEEQNQWLESTGQHLQTGDHRQDLLFMHIPFPEYKTVKDDVIDGYFEEGVCSADKNTGTFDIIKDKTQINYVSVGHDHDNTFHAEKEGIHLCYGQPSGYGSYGKLDRGARIFDLYADHHIDTYVVTKTIQ